VHFFRLDGTVLTEDWEKIYATVCKAEDGDVWEVRLHVLRPDEPVMVRETFALGYYGSPTGPNVLAQWEFIRRYMEEGPEKVLPLLEDIDIHDIVTRYEEYWRGFKLLTMQLGFALVPLTLPAAVCRWVAMQTCDIPQWPEEIESQCLIEENDPYEVDARRLPSEAKAALGIAPAEAAERFR
jgi:hypothetical protein